MALLAVAGESFVGEHAQAITASALSLLPRLIPAPQALLRPLRPVSLPSYPAKLVGLNSGMNADVVGFFANIIHPLEHLPPFGFKVIEIGYQDDLEWDRAVSSQLHTESNNPTAEPKSTATVSGVDPESGRPASTQGIRRRTTIKDRVSNYVSNAPVQKQRNQRHGRTNLWSPLNLVSVISFLMSVGLIAAAIVWQDAVAIIAISLISLAASVICYASWWRPLLLNRRLPSTVRDDLVIRTREGSFLLIKCSENIARELYWGIEECYYYVSGIKYRFLMTLGTVLIIPSVILMGNCTFNMQILMGIAYTLQNVLYWVMGSLPVHIFWDLGNYHWRDVTPDDATNAHQSNRDFDVDTREGMPSFTRTLWYVIREAKRTSWVARSGSTPSTPQWQQWCKEAEVAARTDNRGWQAVARKEEIMRGYSRETDEPNVRARAETQVPPVPTEGKVKADTGDTGVKVDDEGKTDTETKPEVEEKAETKVESNREIKPETQVKLEGEVKTKNQVKPETETRPETEVKPETEVRTERRVRDVSTQTDDRNAWGLD